MFDFLSTAATLNPPLPPAPARDVIKYPVIESRANQATTYVSCVCVGGPRRRLLPHPTPPLAAVRHLQGCTSPALLQFLLLELTRHIGAAGRRCIKAAQLLICCCQSVDTQQSLAINNLNTSYSPPNRLWLYPGCHCDLFCKATIFAAKFSVSTSNSRHYDVLLGIFLEPTEETEMDEAHTSSVSLVFHCFCVDWVIYMHVLKLLNTRHPKTVTCAFKYTCS